MFRPILAAALLLSFPAASQAEGVVSATPGALAGRSPYHASRPLLGTGCPGTMHSLPAGKLPVYGATHVARPGCDELARVADAGSSNVRASR